VSSEVKPDVVALAHRVRAYWDDLELRPNPGVAEPVIEAFEAASGHRLPADIRAFLRVVDGCGLPDHALLDFLPLAEWESLAESYGKFPGGPESAGGFIFADYLLRTSLFVVELSAAPAETAPVYYVNSHGVRVAGSWGEFFAQYLADAAQLFPKAADDPNR
jgi:hypothetical protein